MKTLLPALAASMSLASGASAAVVIDARDVTGGVLVTLGGDLDTTGLKRDPTGDGQENGRVFGFLAFVVGRGASDYYTLPSDKFMRFADDQAGPDYSFGSVFGLYQIKSGELHVSLPKDYVSGDRMNASMFFNNKTIETLGFNRGRYVFRTPADTITINIGPPLPDVEIIDDDNGPPPFGGMPPIVLNPPAVPEPASWVSMILGFGAIGAAIRQAGRHRRTTHAAA